MGIFGDDKGQDERIDALEAHVRGLTTTVQATRAELAEARIALLTLQAGLDEKVSVGDVDPSMVELNEKLGKARAELEQSKAAASDSWAKLKDGVDDALDKLRTSVESAYEKAKKI